MSTLIIEDEEQGFNSEILSEERSESSFILSIVKRRISNIICSSNNENYDNILNMY